ncbi:hypothetical protein ACH5RR_039333 [Cinchona calisaya]|uniref:Uncharacterized protein n=1 Tax=Cinchona calisaya TaxID=153742 RepID=A0ABD2Y0R2_9GENT
MIQLFLSDYNWRDEGNDELVDKRKSLLSELESVLWSLMTSGGRSEVRLWLCNTIAGINSITPYDQRELFVRLLTAHTSKGRLAAQLLQLLFEKQPQKAGPIIAKKSFMLENFFRGNSRRILQWFSNFAGASGLEHRKGAKALSRYAFVNRDTCWEELEWRGKHGQSPAMVATKPHYFLDLDVQRTIENFLEYVPEFWSSSEFAESLKDGEILNIDKRFFVDIFLNFMYKEDMKELWEVIDEFLIEESFSSLCKHLLIVLEEKDLSYFLDLIRKLLTPRLDVAEYSNPSFWLEIILSKCSVASIDQLLLLNALTSQARQLLRLVREEGDLDDKEKVKNIVSQVCPSSFADSLAPIMEGSKKKNLESIKWLGLQSWAIFFRLSEEFRTSESWESLFVNNGIHFQKSDKHGLLDKDEQSEDYGSDLDERSSGKVKHKNKGRNRKKRRRKLKSEESYGDELIDLESLDLQFKADDWLLSTDQYSTTWSSVDLPEHISKHCFYVWIKFVFTGV